MAVATSVAVFFSLSVRISAFYLFEFLFGKAYLLLLVYLGFLYTL